MIWWSSFWSVLLSLLLILPYVFSSTIVRGSRICCHLFQFYRPLIHIWTLVVSIKLSKRVSQYKCSSTVHTWKNLNLFIWDRSTGTKTPGPDQPQLDEICGVTRFELIDGSWQSLVWFLMVLSTVLLWHVGKVYL